MSVAKERWDAAVSRRRKATHDRPSEGLSAGLRCIVPVLLCMLLLTSCGGYESALKAYELGEYKRAAEMLDEVQRAEKNKSRRAEECYLLGECYSKIGYHAKAAAAYSRAANYKYGDDEVLLRLGDTYRILGKFDEADKAYAEYRERRKTDRRTAVGMASSELGRANWAELSKKETSNKKGVDSGYVISPMKEFNSRNSDYCPVYVGDGYDVVYFTSMRSEKKRKKESRITGQGNSTIYMSKIDGKGKWTVPEPMPEPFGQKNIDDGTPSVTPDGRIMMYTHCPFKTEEESAVQCFEMRREGGRWSDPVRVIPGGDSAMMVAHPSLSADGATLYFVSDKEEGGFGGKDIWKSLRNVDGSWGPAQNLGPLINTQGDEMFPYIRQDGTLYYSSNGMKGYGGLDIYKAVHREGDLYDVVNMGMPINSAGDDFGISFMGMAEEGLLSSNRESPKGVDNIYSFYLPPVILTIEGRVVQKPAGTARGATDAKKTTNGNGKKQTAQSQTKKTSASASKKGGQKAVVPYDAFVRIVGSDGTNVKMKAAEDGTVSFVAERDVRYVILAGAPGYANVRTELSTEGLNKTQTLAFTAQLEKIGQQ